METNQSERLTEQAHKGCFVALHVRRPSLRTQLSWDELGLGALKGDLVSAPSAKPPSSSYKVFERLESKMRNIVAVRTVGSWGGFRFVPFEKLSRLYDDVMPYRQQYLDAVGPFLETWEETVNGATALWQERADALWESLDNPSLPKDEFRERLTGALQRTWPEASALRERFGVDLDVIQFQAPEVLPASLASEEVRKVQREARDRARAGLDSFMDEAQNELRARAVETVRRMHRVLVEGSTVTDRSVRPLLDFVDEFRALSVSSDADFQGQLDSLAALIEGRGGAAGMRGNSDVWREVQTQLDEVAQAGEALVEEATARKGFSLERKFSL